MSERKNSTELNELVIAVAYFLLSLLDNLLVENSNSCLSYYT